MKTYLFGAKNLNSDIDFPFWIRKKFPSAYAADRWATRITFEKKDKMYMVWLVPGREE